MVVACADLFGMTTLPMPLQVVIVSLGIAGFVLAYYWPRVKAVRGTAAAFASNRESYDPVKHRQLDAALPFIEESERQARGCGFDVSERLVVRGQDTYVGLVSVFIDRERGPLGGAETGFVIRRRQLESNAELRSNVIFFGTKLAGGGAVATSNKPVGGFLKQPKSIVGAALPQVRDVARLYSIHEKTVERSGSPVWPGPAVSASEWLESAKLEQLESQVEAHRMYFDAGEQLYRPTVRGALLACWIEVPPVKRIRRWHRERRATKLLERYGV